MSKIVHLNCCICGESTKGRQWWNRDTGWGLCSACANRYPEANVPMGQHDTGGDGHPYYGIRGYHYDIQEADNA